MTETTAGREPELMDRHAAAALMGVHPRTVHRWAQRGLISVVRNPMTRVPYYRRSELLALREFDAPDS